MSQSRGTATEVIWVLQTAFLGDCVLSLPFLHRLCELYPRAHVRIICTPKTRGIFELALMRGLSFARERMEIVTFDKRGVNAGFFRLWNFVSDQKRVAAPQKVFCLQRSLRTAMMAWLSGAEERIGFASGSAAFLYSHAVARDWHNGRHEIEKNLDLLRALQSERKVEPWSAKDAPSLLAPPSYQGVTQDADAPLGLAMGSPWPTKRWPVRNAAELLQKLTAEGHRIKLLGDPAAVPLAEALVAEVPSLLIENKVGKTDLGEWVDEIAACRLMLCNDSAAVHVASDLGVPVVALFGPTLPEFGFAPFRPHSKVLGLSDLECRPCHIHGPKRCPLGHHRCLEDMSGAKVYPYVKSRL